MKLFVAQIAMLILNILVRINFIKFLLQAGLCVPNVTK